MCKWSVSPSVHQCRERCGWWNGRHVRLPRAAQPWPVGAHLSTRSYTLRRHEAFWERHSPCCITVSCSHADISGSEFYSTQLAWKNVNESVFHLKRMIFFCNVHETAVFFSHCNNNENSVAVHFYCFAYWWHFNRSIIASDRKLHCTARILSSLLIKKISKIT